MEFELTALMAGLLAAYERIKGTDTTIKLTVDGKVGYKCVDIITKDGDVLEWRIGTNYTMYSRSSMPDCETRPELSELKRKDFFEWVSSEIGEDDD